jgi:hypothetical protein
MKTKLEKLLADLDKARADESLSPHQRAALGRAALEMRAAITEFGDDG